MRLLCTPASLYSRIVRVVAAELGIELPIEYVGVRAEAGKLLEYNPAGKVPTLVLDDESMLAESRPICEYLESLAGRHVLAGLGDHQGRQLESVVAGFVDGLAVWVREERRPRQDQSADIIALERSRASRCLAYFDGRPLEAPAFGYAQISLAVALDVMTQHVDQQWLETYPKLASWYRASLG